MEESLVPAAVRQRLLPPAAIDEALLMAAVSLRIWVAARCHPGLNRFEIALTDRVDYLWRRDDLLHGAQPRESRRGSLFLLPSR